MIWKEGGREFCKKYLLSKTVLKRGEGVKNIQKRFLLKKKFHFWSHWLRIASATTVRRVVSTTVRAN